MKKLLNTLYITTHGAWMTREGESLVVRVEQEERLRLPILTIEGIVCIAGVGFSPQLLSLCMEKGVTVSFLTEGGDFMARVTGQVTGNVMLRRAQYRAADDPAKASELARAVTIGKIANCRTVLMRAAREHKNEESRTVLSNAATRLGRIIDGIGQGLEVDLVRGKEGEAAWTYFSVFDHLIIMQKEVFTFKERSRRPPLDRINALLSFIYTILVHDIRGALEGVGLDPQVGYLHAERPGRPSLALDMVEEFRPFLADRLALSLINRQQLNEKSFRTTETGAVFLNDEGRKEVLKAYQERKREEILHPFIEEKVPFGLLPHVQGQLLARHLRGDLDGYPPFFWK